MKRQSRFLGFVALTLSTVISGCAKERSAGAPCCPCLPAGRQPLDQALLSRLSTARSYHHQVDILLRQGQRPSAIDRLKQLLASGLSDDWSETREVRIDNTARLAQLLLAEQGDGGEALVWVDSELAKPHPQSFYLANLHAVRGDILEARAKRIDKMGDKVEAKRWARQAIAAFERSIAINKSLQARLKRKAQTKP